MNSRFLIVVVFLAGLGIGWFAQSLTSSTRTTFAVALQSVKDNFTGSIPIDADDDVDSTARSTQDSGGVSADDNLPAPGTLTSGITSQAQQQQFGSGNTVTPVNDVFEQLLKDRRYAEAMVLLEEQKQKSEQSASQLRGRLLKELKFLTEVQNGSDFSALIESYLSVYYDDVDVLLLLADFNQSSGRYFEAVDVYLLARTYAYSNVDREKVVSEFNRFVEATDSGYTAQKDWWFLIDLYSHINTSGLMTSTHQYRQALAHLRSGDEIFAIEQFNQLLNDTLVGESAAIALNNLTGEAEVTVNVGSSPWEGAESVALEKSGNQFLVNLNNNRQESVQLLIDTGASMTAVSRTSFDTLNADGNAVVEGQRVFRTANGPVVGTVFSVPELSLGPYVLENTQVAVIDFDSGRRIDGLLGMNILGQFQFHIEQDSSRLLLNKK